jgi:hypothetical protein
MPGISGLLTFGRRISATGGLQHLVKVTMLMTADTTAHQILSVSPYAGLLHGIAKISTLSYDVVQFGQRAQLTGQSPHNDDRFHAFGTESAENFY